MISIDSLGQIKHAIVHENCSDGTASAMILKDVIPDLKITFAQYNTDAHRDLVAEPGMVFCDFSPHKERVQAFLDVGTIVLDHHKTAKAVVDPFVEAGLGAFGDEVSDPGVCGAVLAYREVWLPLKVGNAPEKISSDSDLLTILPEHGSPGSHQRTIYDLATLAGIRDTWVKDSPRWKEACEQADAIFFWPWDKIAVTGWRQWAQELLAIGPVLSARNARNMEKSVKGSHRFQTAGGKRVMVFEGTKATSDAAEKMAAENDLTIGFSIFVEDGLQKMIFSTRSRGAFDCSALALAHGGGGHSKAAGFNFVLVPATPQPFTLVESLLDNYEAVEANWLSILSTLDPKTKPNYSNIYQKLVTENMWAKANSAQHPEQLKLFATP
jgi:hypothetical protein